MTASAQPNKPFTHVAYFFIKTGGRRGKVYGYWKDGGRFREDGGDNYFAFVDMVVRGGWDGRIRFVKGVTTRSVQNCTLSRQRPERRSNIT